VTRPIGTPSASPLETATSAVFDDASGFARSLLGVKQTCRFALQMSAYDPKRTCGAVRGYVLAYAASVNAESHAVCYPPRHSITHLGNVGLKPTVRRHCA